MTGDRMLAEDGGRRRIATEFFLHEFVRSGSRSPLGALEHFPRDSMRSSAVTL